MAVPGHERHCSARKKRKEWVKFPGLGWQYTGYSASPDWQKPSKKVRSFDRPCHGSKNIGQVCEVA
jgi:hypothetical protein